MIAMIKKLKPVFFLLLIGAVWGCQNNMKKPDMVVVDVNADYPEKKIKVQDFADIEYVPLETTDSFITQGLIQDIGKKYIIVVNYINDGNIFVFDRNTGKGLKVINHLGQGGEEYTTISEVVLSETSNEVFVSDYFARKVLVYDLNGTFKRSFPTEDQNYYNTLSNYDADNLWVFKHASSNPSMEDEKSCHALISKEDGRVVKEIKVPVDKIETVVLKKDGMTITVGFSSAIASADSWGIARMSSDTIYHYDEDGLSPVITRTPSIHSMEIQKFLYLTAETDNYYFLQTMEKDFDMEKKNGFEKQDYMIDKRDNQIYVPVVLNGDFTDEKEMAIGEHAIVSDRNIFAYRLVEAADLVESREDGTLGDKLKSIASTLDEESNPVLMILKNK